VVAWKLLFIDITGWKNIDVKQETDYSKEISHIHLVSVEITGRENLS
jgi:hypothetical protein